MSAMPSMGGYCLEKSSVWMSSDVAMGTKWQVEEGAREGACNFPSSRRNRTGPIVRSPILEIGKKCGEIQPGWARLDVNGCCCAAAVLLCTSLTRCPYVRTAVLLRVVDELNGGVIYGQGVVGCELAGDEHCCKHLNIVWALENMLCGFRY